MLLVWAPATKEARLDQTTFVHGEGQEEDDSRSELAFSPKIGSKILINGFDS
jgi:hypothetical protein